MIPRILATCFGMLAGAGLIRAQDGVPADSLDLLLKLRAFEEDTSAKAAAEIAKQRSAAIRLLREIEAKEAAKGNLQGVLKVRKAAEALEAGKSASDAEKVDLLASALVTGGNRNGNAVDLEPAGSLTSAKMFAPPVRLTYEVNLVRNDFRIQYAAKEIIFNWEGNPDDLRISGGPASGQHRPGKGRVPTGKYVTVVQEVLPGKMSVSVDGRERATWLANFSAIRAPVRVFTYRDGVSIRSMTAEKLPLE